jgi:hypothetical protein
MCIMSLATNNVTKILPYCWNKWLIFVDDHLDNTEEHPDILQCSVKCPNGSTNNNYREFIFASLSGQFSGHLDTRALVQCGVWTTM